MDFNNITIVLNFMKFCCVIQEVAATKDVSYDHGY
jgi:hypothetical protein